MIRNILFDWSGTLVDDLPAVWRTSNALLERAGRPSMSLEQFREEFALPFTGFYDRHAGHVPIASLEAWFHDEFPKHQHSVVELPHARNFLECCRARKIRCFLLSSIHPNQFEEQCTRIPFHQHLEKAYVGVRDKRLKIREILSDHNLSPDQTAFIGDMEHDVETARHGGIHAFAVLTGYNKHRQLESARPDLLVQNLAELQQILESLDFDLKRIPLLPAQPIGS